MQDSKKSLPTGFIELLHSCSLSEKKAMLLVLNDDINTITTKHQNDIKNSSNEQLKSHVKYIPNCLDNSRDLQIEDVEAELASMKLCSPTAKAVKTQWINSKDEVYNFGNVSHPAKSFDEFPKIKELLDLVNNCGETTGDLDSCLVTCYSNSKTSLSLHADDEAEIDQNSSIATISFGIDRTIEFKRKFNKRRGRAPVEFSYELQHGSICIMRPGCQQALKHRVDKGVHVVNGCNIRYSISFRKLTSSESTSFIQSTKTSSPVKNTITLSENLINNNKLLDAPVASNCDNSKSNLPRENVSLIAGDSFTARLDPFKLGRDKKRVINVSRGGNKIKQVMDSLDEYYLVCPPQYNIDQLFICVGTNDIRNCKTNGVRHLRNPLIQLISKAKLLFPSANIFLQTLLPLPIADFNFNYVVSNVMEYNALIEELCHSEHVYILDVFWSFVEAGFRNPSFFHNDIRDCHPNRWGLAKLAVFYIEKIRSIKFNPYMS